MPLQKKYILAKQKRLALEREVTKTAGQANLLQSRISRENIRQSLHHTLYNKFYTAAKVRQDLREDLRDLREARQATLEDLKEKTVRAKSLRDCRAKQIRHSLLTSKSTIAKLDKSALSDQLNRSIEER